jgi:hypothetical protein
MNDFTLFRIAQVAARDGRDWVCRTRLEHLDWRPLLAAGLVEQAPALGHVRLTRRGWGRVHEAQSPLHPRVGEYAA